MRLLCHLSVFLLAQLLLCSGLVAQDVQLDFRQFTTDDGLPSSEVYTVLEDQEGYIWVGTDNGVARFDGYSFEVFDSDDGLGDVVVFYLLLDGNGTIWAGTYSGRIYFFEGGEFVEFEHNDKIAAVRKVGELINLIDINDKNELIIRIQRTGIFCVDRKGSIRKISSDDPSHFYIYSGRIKKDLGANIAPVRRGYLDNLRTNSRDSIYIKYMVGAEEGWQEVGKFQVVPFELGENRVIYCCQLFPEKYFLVTRELGFEIFHNDQKVKNIPFDGPYVRKLMVTSDTSAWALMGINKGLLNLRFSKDFSKLIVDTILTGTSLSNGMTDSNGGLWMSSLNDGLFYCSSSMQRKYVDDEESKILSVHAVNEESFFTGGSSGELIYNEIMSDFSRFTFQRATLNGIITDAIFYDQDNDVVYGSTFKYSFSEWQLDGEEPFPYYMDKDDGLRFFKTIREFNSSSHISSNKLLVSNQHNFGFLERETGRFLVLNPENKGFEYGLETFYVDKEGRHLLGTVNGLKQFVFDESGGLARDVNLGVEELNERVVKILELKDGSMLFGTRGNGIVHLGVDTTIIRQSDGLASDMVRHLHQSSDGTIWVSTLNGLSKVELLKDTFTVRTFRTENGLIDNEVHMVDTYGEAVYLATSSGVQRFIEPPLNYNSTPPVIRLLNVDGDTLPVQDHFKLKSGYHSVNIHYSTINHRLGSKINYRYRLDEEEDWAYTQQRTVSFPRLGAGSFNFSVQSQNEDGFWSKDTQLTIEIPKLWYNTVYAWGGLTLLVGSIVFGVFYVREERRKKEQDFISQISKLEHEALHARMNPHFVFNCLNSIQNFVLDNDTRSAATYLSRFSSLIRQILRSSVEGKHTLREEVQMLEKYLDLEKLRFKTAFTHTISVDAALDLDAISLPPLLVQPFVENAILHGMKGRKQGGRIKVIYSGDVRLLKVTVTDNGKGFDRELSEKKDSMGMDITRRRLSMMDTEGDLESGMTVIPLFSEDGQAIGTRVELTIIPDIDELLAVDN